jgi:chorismate dehydratase
MSLVSPITSLGGPLKPPARLGQLSFINTLPVTIAFEKNYLNLDCQVTYGTPTQLNAAYAANQLDLGAMSSFFFLQNPDLQLLEGLSISCDGPVGSVLLFSKVSPEKLQGAQIAVPTSSATSVNLLRVLLKQRFNLNVNCAATPTPSLAGEETQAALVIGDHALQVDRDWSNCYYRCDLGQCWSQQFNLPMVFGVWAAQRSWAQDHRQELDQITSSLCQARDLGLSSLFAAVMTEAGKRSGLEAHRLRKYYQEQLNFELTPRHREGLKLFANLCRRWGFNTIS